MKGLIFTEFLELVEEKWGMVMVDKIITKAQDPIDGSYNAIQYYPHGQLVKLVVELSNESGVPVPDLLRVYGHHLFFKLAEGNPDLIEGINSTFEMLQNIELVIHTEVRKLYPESNPPKFDSELISDHKLKLIYNSHRSMADVAHGLVLGCADYFKEKIEVEQVDTNDDHSRVEFLLTQVA